MSPAQIAGFHECKLILTGAVAAAFQFLAYAYERAWGLMIGNDEMDAADIRTRVVALEHGRTEDRQRLTALEVWKQQTEISGAKLDVRFEEMGKRLNRIDANLSRLMWLFIGGIVAGIVAFLLKGGFNLPG